MSAAGPSRAARSASRIDVGRVRPVNEDALVDRPDLGLWAVADGMGGHSRGDVASGRIKEALEALEPPEGGGVAASLAAVQSELERVHAWLRADAGAGVSGSTVVVLVADGGGFACAWAGDSRLWRYRPGGGGGEGGLERMTKDHSLVEELVTAGVITSEEARTHPLANRITRTVGVGPRLELSRTEGPVAAGDRFLLSSDGLHGVLPHADLARLVAVPDLEAAADGLMRAALEAGAPDNISLVLVEPAGAMASHGAS